MSKVYLAKQTSSEQTATLGGGLPSGGGGDAVMGPESPPRGGSAMEEVTSQP